MKIRAVIVDDETSAIETLIKLIEGLLPDVVIVETASNIEEGVKIITDYSPDLVFLDIELGDRKGFDLLDIVDHSGIEIIFVTAYEEHAIKAFKYEAIDYVLKPIESQDLVRAVNKVKTKRTIEEARKHQTVINTAALMSTKVAIPSLEGIKYIELADIIRIEADGSYATIILRTGKNEIVTKPLRYFETLLDPRLFYRVHRSHMINSSFILEYRKSDGGYILMNNGDKIHVSESHKDVVKKLLI